MRLTRASSYALHAVVYMAGQKKDGPIASHIIAEKRGIPVIGTLGVMREAATLGLLDLRIAVKRLEATSFHIAPEILARLLK